MMKAKIPAAVLAAVLALGLCMPALADGEAGARLTAVDMRRLADVLHEEHILLHATLQAFSMDNGSGPMVFTVVSKLGGPIYSLVDCLTLVTEQPGTPMPQTAQEALEIARELVTSTLDLARLPQNYQLVNDTMLWQLSAVQLAEDWLALRHLADEAAVMMVPVRFADADGNALDGKAYALYIDFTQEGYSLWLCSDNALTYRMLRTIAPEASDADSAWVGEWMDSYEQEHPEEAFTPEQVPVSERGLTGLVRIISDNNVNIRADGNQDARAIGRGQPGEWFDSTGPDEARGWLGVILPDGRQGYVSPNMAEYIPD